MGEVSKYALLRNTSVLAAEVPAFKYRQVFGGVSLIRMRDLHAAITVLSRR